jgi:hypothetical protein
VLVNELEAARRRGGGKGRSYATDKLGRSALREAVRCFSMVATLVTTKKNVHNGVSNILGT